MNVLDYIAHETERQSGTPAEEAGMHRAYEYFVNLQPFVLVIDDVLKAISMINGLTSYRHTPVVFRDGGPSADHETIPRLMNNLFVHGQDLSADEFTKEFLDIHPFTDGNGRVGSLIWNYLSGTIEDPEPMPYFFGQDNG